MATQTQTSFSFVQDSQAAPKQKVVESRLSKTAKALRLTKKKTKSAEPTSVEYSIDDLPSPVPVDHSSSVSDSNKEALLVDAEDLMTIRGFLKNRFIKQKPQEIETIREELKEFLSQKNYPCPAAVRSFFKNEYKIGVYEELGSGRSSRSIADDLAAFQEDVKTTQSPYLSFFAVFADDETLTEEEFEKNLWKEVSYLAADSRFSRDWDERFSSNPADGNFCFSFNGEAFFIVGLFPGSSRKARRFKRPTLIFNSFNQFGLLKEKGLYDDMIKISRERDKAFDGSVNPMAEKHGEQWEAIQFSGKQNTSEWKCPFAHLKDLLKL